MIGTQPGCWHDFAFCYWRFYDRRGQQVAVISDEAYARQQLGTVRDLVLSSS